jgi:hypothetical protein
MRFAVFILGAHAPYPLTGEPACAHERLRVTIEVAPAPRRELPSRVWVRAA